LKIYTLKVKTNSLKDFVVIKERRLSELKRFCRVRKLNKGLKKKSGRLEKSGRRI